MDSAMSSQYTAIRAFLPRDLLTGAASSPQRQSAREKLTRLTKQQFQELSTDVFDEMKRRQLDAAEVPFLPVRDDFHPKRNQARQKLATLPASRFRDLASDVLFEIERRFPWVSRDAALGGVSGGLSAGGYGGGYIAPNNGPSSGSLLGGDYGGGNRSFLGDPNAALYRNSQPVGTPSAYMSPAPPGISAAELGRIRQDYELRIQRITEDVSKIRADYERRIQDYDMKLADSERRNQLMGQDIGTLKNEYEGKLINIAQEARTLRTDYESKIDLMQRQLDTLNANLNETTRRHNDNLNQLTDTTRRYNENAAQQAELVRRYNDTVGQLNAAKIDLDKARKDFALVQEELRLMTRKNDEIIAARDGDLMSIQRLAEENRILANQLEEARARATAAAAAAAAAATAQMNVQAIPPPVQSQSAFIPSTTLELDPVLNVSPDYVVSPARLSSYRAACQDLVKASQSEQPTMVLVAMKSVVIACKTITEDIEGAENGIPYNDTERGMLANGKGQLSAALSGLMAVAKAHAAGTSWGPEALVTSANQLTAAVNDLARAAGSTARAEPEHVEAQALPPAPALSVTAPEPPVQQVRYTPPVQQQQPPPAAPSPTYEPPTVPRPPSSSYSAPAPAPAPVIAPPPVVETQAAAPMSPPSAAVQSDASPSQRQTEVVELDELKLYLEKQTDQIVKAIQQLLYAMRQSTSYGQDFKETVGGITNIVDELVDTTQSAFAQPSAAHLRNQGEEILRSLRASNEKLQELGDSIVNTPQTQAKSVKQKLASASYEVAKQVKELINLLPE